MPRRTDISSIMILGAGPIVIGQACEFDYSGTQACMALKKEGYKIILVNSNPATIMTDPEIANATYIEPITPDFVTKVIEKEKPDALIPTMGGQTALNTALALAENGTLRKFGIELIGANMDSIKKAEGREEFKEAMTRIGLETPKGLIAKNFNAAQKAFAEIGLPAVIRPSFTLAGTGGGIANTKKEFDVLVAKGFEESPTHSVLVEESVAGWKEFEMEVVRDQADNCIIICSIENVDPMGTHTGDSITVAPALTLTDKEYQLMRNASIAVIREIGVNSGGSNVQFAVNANNGRMLVIEMNPRVSRSSALASKATGFPIAKVAALLAVGYTLDELINDITGITPASFEPTIDYVVTKIPRFTFEKFPDADTALTTSMKSIGEVMAIGRTFCESLQKALRSLETGLTGLDEINFPKAKQKDRSKRTRILGALSSKSPYQILMIAQALRFGLNLSEIAQVCHYDPWFIEQIQEIIRVEEGIRKKGLPKTSKRFFQLKSLGFSDLRIANLAGINEAEVTSIRQKLNVFPVFKRIDTCAAEFPSITPYMYSTYESNGHVPSECEANPSDKKKIVILGSGPNRIGQGIEFDYCCVHAIYALHEIGLETIMINCNPETVSTDYDTSDRLYFEPLTSEDVIAIVSKEREAGELIGVLLQFGGQTPLKLAHSLKEAGIKILGTSPDNIDRAEDRERFHNLLQELNLKQPKNGLSTSLGDATKPAERIGYPVVIRPSYVLGGRGMEIVKTETELKYFFKDAIKVSGTNPVLVEKFLENAIEVDVDAVVDIKGEVYIAGVMEHIEEAGIHSGDSACSLPPYSLPENIVKKIELQTISLARELKIFGLMNVQFALKKDQIFVIEVNPRASRSVPFVAKATGFPIAKLAAKILTGDALNTVVAHYKFNSKKQFFAVKEVVFPFSRFNVTDVILGPEMKSTGEVMGIDEKFAGAFAKSQIGAGQSLPIKGTVFISVKDKDKPEIVEVAQRLIKLGFHLIATKGTAESLKRAGLAVEKINKVMQGTPHIVDALKDGRVDMVFNTVSGAREAADSRSIRKTAIDRRIPYCTTISGAKATISAISTISTGKLDVTPIQAYFNR